MKNLILFLMMLLLIACSSVFAQDYTYDYEFNKKLRHNIDEIISNGIQDTCGVIPFNYPISLSNGEETSLVFNVDNDCSPTIDLSNLIPLGNYIEVNIDDKYHTFIKGEEIKKEEISKKIRDLFLSYKGQKDFPKVMLRVGRSCNKTDKIHAILNAVHYGYYSSKVDHPLIFDLGKSSRAEPPKLDMQVDEDD